MAGAADWCDRATVRPARDWQTCWLAEDGNRPSRRELDAVGEGEELAEPTFSAVDHVRRHVQGWQSTTTTTTTTTSHLKKKCNQTDSILLAFLKN
jgi:hypothetical protein